MRTEQHLNIMETRSHGNSFGQRLILPQEHWKPLASRWETEFRPFYRPHRHIISCFLQQRELVWRLSAVTMSRKNFASRSARAEQTLHLQWILYQRKMKSYSARQLRWQEWSRYHLLSMQTRVRWRTMFWKRLSPVIRLRQRLQKEIWAGRSSWNWEETLKENIWHRQILREPYLEHIQVVPQEFPSLWSILLQMWWQLHSRCRFLFRRQRFRRFGGHRFFLRHWSR